MAHMAQRDAFFPLNVEALPAGWTCAPIGELVATIRPGFASGKHTDERFGVPHLRPMNISREGKLDLSLLLHVPEGKDLRVRPGDVLFNNTNSRELVGKTAPINDGEYGFSNHMTRLRAAKLGSPIRCLPTPLLLDVRVLSSPSNPARQSSQHFLRHSRRKGHPRHSAAC